MYFFCLKKELKAQQSEMHLLLGLCKLIFSMK